MAGGSYFELTPAEIAAINAAETGSGTMTQTATTPAGAVALSGGSGTSGTAAGGQRPGDHVPDGRS